MRGIAAIVGGLIAAVCASSGLAQELCPGDEFIKLLASDGSSRDVFAESVAISGDIAIVGSPLDDDSAGDAGSAYVYERNGLFWNEAAKLLAPDGSDDDAFGESVAIDGDIIFVGAIRDDDRGTDSGSVYVFEKVGGVWTQVAKLTAPDGQEGDLFGWSVAISGDTAIIGARGDDDRELDAGSVYVFERVGNTWNETAKLTATDGQANDNYGVSVAIDGDTAIVGAHRDDDQGLDAGSAYIFERVGNAWNQIDKLTATDGQEDNFFGFSVAIDGDTAIVGAYRNDDLGTYAGSAYLLRKNNGIWTQSAKLLAFDGQEGDNFGWSVAISAGTSIIGAIGDDDLGMSAGSAYIVPWTRPNDCCADIDHSGVLDAGDFFVFLDLFAADDLRADFNGDVVIDAGDFFIYLDEFAAGCP